MHVRLLRPLRPTWFLVGAGLVFYVGCSSSGSTTPAVTHPTMIEVAPEDFLGQVPCATEGAGLKRYVATLIDLNYDAGGAGGEATTTADGFRAPSSLPTPCRAAVGFGFVVPGRHYRVEIDGYDTEDIEPRALGASDMVATTTPEGAPEAPIVAPHWRASCERAVGVDSTIIRAGDCTPFMGGQGPGSVRFALAPLLGDLACGSKPGQVERLSVTLTGGGDSTQADIPCTDDAEALFADLAPLTLVSAYVTAFSAGSLDAVAGATCNASTLPGARVDATCTRLSTLGTLRVDLPAALQQLGVTCNSDDLTTVLLKPAGAENAQSVAPPACLQPFDHGFPAGEAIVEVSAVPADAAAATLALSCHGTVAPGQVVVAVCDPQ